MVVDLAGDDDEPGGQQRLDRDPAVRVLGEHRVEDRVADLVGDLVRVTLGHGLGGEKASSHVVVPLAQWCRLAVAVRSSPARRSDGHRSQAVSSRSSSAATRSQTTWASAALEPRGTCGGLAVGVEHDGLVVGAAEHPPAARRR